MSESPISHVSDTARWVAVYRAWETVRPDALFRDPFAERLASERGRPALPARALVKFAPDDGVAFFEPAGWRAREVRSIFRAAVRFRRAPLWMRPLALFPDPDPRRPGKARWSAVVRFERR